MKRKRALAELSWTEHAEIDKNRAVVIIPLGVVEQQGPAGYQGADFIVSETIAAAVADRLEHVYVAPTLTHGCSHAYRNFAGTISLRPETLYNLLLDVVEGYIAHGWTKILIFNSHGVNDPIVDMVGQAIKGKHDLSIGHFSPLRTATHFAGAVYPEPTKAYGHGGELVLSVLMALRPGVIDLARASGTPIRAVGPFLPVGPTQATFEGFPFGLYTDMEELTPSGATAHPANANEENGRTLVERMVDFSSRFVEAFKDTKVGP